MEPQEFEIGYYTEKLDLGLLKVVIHRKLFLRIALEQSEGTGRNGKLNYRIIATMQPCCEQGKCKLAHRDMLRFSAYYEKYKQIEITDWSKLPSKVIMRVNRYIEDLQKVLN